MKIEKALYTDAEELTALTLQSKAYWGYSSEQIALWKTDLTITTHYLDEAEVYKLSQKGQLIGYYSYLELDHEKIELDNIFMAPEFIGKGYGKMLMDHFFEQVKRTGHQSIKLDSEPGAEGFYQHLGFKVIGQLESSIKNRFLPIMELKIK